MTDEPKPEPMFDVAIFSIEDRKIVSVIGKSLREERANTRMETGLGKVNEAYDVDIFPAGSVKVGMVAPEVAP